MRDLNYTAKLLPDIFKKYQLVAWLTQCILNPWSLLAQKPALAGELLVLKKPPEKLLYREVVHILVLSV